MNGGNEMSMRGYASASGFIFAVVAILHLIRVIAGWEFRVGGWEAPSWVSLVALAVAGYLSYQGLRIAGRSAGSG